MSGTQCDEFPCCTYCTYVFLVLMYTLSMVFHSLHLLDLSTMCAASPSMFWLVFIQWAALAFCNHLWPLLFVFSDSGLQSLLLSLMYVRVSHCAQRIWYTTPLSMCFCGPFTLVNRPLSVDFCWNTVVLRPYGKCLLTCLCPLYVWEYA